MKAVASFSSAQGEAPTEPKPAQKIWLGQSLALPKWPASVIKHRRLRIADWNATLPFVPSAMEAFEKPPPSHDRTAFVG
jgi:hypothetical protein